MLEKKRRRKEKRSISSFLTHTHALALWNLRTHTFTLKLLETGKHYSTHLHFEDKYLLDKSIATHTCTDTNADLLFELVKTMIHTNTHAYMHPACMHTHTNSERDRKDKWSSAMLFSLNLTILPFSILC